MNIFILFTLVLGSFVLSQTVWAKESEGRCRAASSAHNTEWHDKKIKKQESKNQERVGNKARQQSKERINSETKKEERECIQENVQKRIDKRQQNQERRIQHGIKKGYLTQDEINKLEQQQANIAALEKQSFADGKLTKEEAKEIRAAIDEASRCIWAEKHDTEGNQMPVYRLGSNVFAKDSLTSQLASEELSQETAKSILKDFRTIMQLKKRLTTEELSDSERSKIQSEYDNLLNQYFEVR